MSGIRKILVPVDFSATAQKAFQFALRLGNQLGAALHLLHVIYPQMENIEKPLMPSSVATLDKKLVAEKKLEAFAAVGQAAWEKTGKDSPKISIHVAVGGAISVIKSQAVERAFDLIVMGTRGEHESVENLLGTVASDVVGNAVCPVIVVPEYTEAGRIAKVAHAIEPAWVTYEDVKRAVENLLPVYEEVHLVRFSNLEHSATPSKLLEFRKELEIAYPGISIKIHRLGKRELLDDLNGFAQKEHIDLLVMYRSKTGFLKKLFHRSRSRQMAKKTKVPLLVI